MNKRIAIWALGSAGLITLGASVAHAQLGGILKALKDAAGQLQSEASVTPAPSSSPAIPTTLAGRWLPASESCTANRGQSDQVLEIKGNSKNWSWGTCSYPQSIAGKAAYAGIGKCSDEEGNTYNEAISYKISSSGNMIIDAGSGRQRRQTAFKRCSNPLYFTNDEVPEPVKTAPIRGAQAASKNRGETLISCQVGSKNVNVIRSSNKYIYTYGAPGIAPEMSIESTGKDGRLFKYFGVYHGGNQFQQLRFVNGQTNYIIYVSSYYGKNALLVSINKGVETERKCISNVDYWDRQLNLLDISEDSEDNATIR